LDGVAGCAADVDAFGAACGFGGHHVASGEEGVGACEHAEGGTLAGAAAGLWWGARAACPPAPVVAALLACAVRRATDVGDAGRRRRAGPAAPAAPVVAARVACAVRRAASPELRARLLDTRPVVPARPATAPAP